MCNARKGLVTMEGNNKKKFNLVDFVVVIAIVAVFAFVGFKIFAGDLGGGEKGTYRVTYFCEEVPEFASTIIKAKDKVLDEQKNTDLGVVKEVILDDSWTYTTNSDGAILRSGKEGYDSVELITEVKADEYDFGMMVDSSKYGVGHSITIRVGKAKIFGRISGIEKID